MEMRTGVTLITRTRQLFLPESEGGRYLFEEETEGKPYQYCDVELAGVFDNTLWGFVGPVNGRRIRVSGNIIPPTAGSQYSYGVAILDARKYFHYFKKYGLALRLSGGISRPLVGRDNPRLFYLGGVPGNIAYLFLPYFLDTSIESNYFATVVMPLRGYSLGAANPEGNTNFLLSNIEFRFPFVTNISFNFPFPFSIRYIMGALFWDMGGAWNDISDFDPIERDSSMFFTFKDIKSGIGFGLRLNLFGALVLKWDRALRLGEDHVTEDYISLGAEF
jgi:outer membrane protein assembly factor BamA